MLLKLRRTLPILLVVMLPDVPVRAADNPATVLLVDDHDILYRAGTKRVLHPARRHSVDPLVGEDKPWELTIGWMSVYRNPASGKYQLWYQAYAGPLAPDRQRECVVCYAESDDGLKFTKPELDLYSFKEFARTNIVLLGNGIYGSRYANAVIVDPREVDPQRRYKMAYYDWSLVNGRPAAGLHIAFSPDGIHWKKHPEGPLLLTSYGSRGMQPPLVGEDPLLESEYKGAVRRNWRLPLTMSDAVDLIHDPRTDRFVIYGKMWLQGPDGGIAWKHGMGRTESRDLLRWSRPELILGPDDLDPEDLEFHTSPVFVYRNMYFGLNQILNRREGGTMNIELMTSRDGLRFERPFRNQWFIARAPEGRFDAGSIFSNATPVILPDEIRFYFGAYDKGAVGGGAHITSKEQKSGVGLAVIPRDRFAGITTVPRSAEPTLAKPLEHVGQITLKPRNLQSVRTITVNADARDGAIRGELLDAEGYRVADATRDDAQPLTGDSLRHEVRWRKFSLADLPPGQYSLRLHLHRATAYAVTFAE